MRAPVVVVVLAAAAAAVLVAAACKDGGGSSSSSSTSGQGGCPSSTVPQALYTVHITAAGSPLPPDTTLLVTWSAGSEPEVVLDDPQTWRTLDDGANVVCDLPPGGPPPTDSELLTCELWTSGATEVEVRASSYQTYRETLRPTIPDGCEQPVPAEAQIELVAAQDAGTGG